MALVGVLGKPHARGGQWASHCLEMGYGIITPTALSPPDTRSHLVCQLAMGVGRGHNFGLLGGRCL